MAEEEEQRRSTKSKSLAKERLVSLQRIVSEGECIFSLPSTESVVDGMHIRSSIVVTPKQAKYGGAVLQGCAEGVEDVRVPADIIGECNPDKTIVFPHHGLPIINRDRGGHRGNHTVVITISGYKKHMVADSGSLQLVSTGTPNPPKASRKFPGAVGSLHKYKVDRDTRSPKAATPITAPAPQPKQLDKVAAYGTLLNGIRDLQPLAVLKASFCTSIGIGVDADDAAFHKSFKGAKRASLTKGEFRHVDQGGSLSKSTFALNTAHNLLFPDKNEQEHLDLRRMYDGLSSRLVPDWKNEWQGWPSSPNKKGAADDDPTEELKLIFETFATIYPDFKTGASFAVEPVTVKSETVQATDFHGDGGYKQSQVKFVPGGGNRHEEYPWRGDLKIDVHVDDIKAKLNGQEYILEKRKTVKWDLQVTYPLTSYEIYSGKATIVLNHPDGETYYINLAAGGSDGGDSESGPIFQAGKHVYQLNSLGVSKEKGSTRRGELYLILDSSTA